MFIVHATQPGNAAFVAASAVSQNVVVNGVPQTIAFNPPATKTYGDAPFVLSATATPSGLPVSLSRVSGPATLDPATHTLTITGAGTVIIKASQAGGQAVPGGPRYSPAEPVERILVVGKKTLTPVVADASRAFGEDNPEFTISSYTGFVGADNDSAITTDPTLTSTATASSPPGAYPIAVSGGVAANYTLAANPRAATLTVIGYGGAYEALLFSPDDTDLALPLGKLELSVSTKNLAYTGILSLAAEASPVALKGTLIPSPDGNLGEHIFDRAATTRLPALSLAISVPANGRPVGGFTGEVRRDEAPLATLAHPARLAPPPAPLGTGAYTLVLRPATTLDDDDSRPVPGGSGHATATLAAKTAYLVLNGKLADGSRLSATLKPSADRSYRLWVNPYAKRAGSGLGGRVALLPHPDATRFADRFYLPAGALVWQKAALPDTTPASGRDKSYRAGFGPLDVSAALDPWLPPTPAKKASGTTPATPAITLAQRLGLAVAPAEAGPFGLDYLPPASAAFTEAQIDSLPASLTLAATGKPVLPVPNPAKFALSLSPATGAFTGSFLLSDIVPPATKATTRKITFSGTLRQAPTADSSLVGAGFFLVPGLIKTDEQPSGEIRFTLP